MHYVVSLRAICHVLDSADDLVNGVVQVLLLLHLRLLMLIQLIDVAIQEILELLVTGGH